MKKLELISSVEDAYKNIQTFNMALENKDDLLRKRLSTFQHWFYNAKTDMFGPSKFIGYKDDTFIDYKEGSDSNNCDHYMDGTDTQPILKKMFKLVSEEQYDKLYVKLESLLNQYDKKPNKRTKIYIIK